MVHHVARTAVVARAAMGDFALAQAQLCLHSWIAVVDPGANMIPLASTVVLTLVQICLHWFRNVWRLCARISIGFTGVPTRNSTLLARSSTLPLRNLPCEREIRPCQREIPHYDCEISHCKREIPFY